MPKVTPITFDVKSAILGPADRAAGLGTLAPRSPGLHISDIYGDLDKAQREREMKNGEMTDAELQFYRSGGFIWETLWGMAMAECIRKREIVRPGEFKIDGVIGSPDNVRLDPWRIIETKATWKSVRKWDDHVIEKHFWIWGVQMKGYCRMMGTRECEIYVIFMNGDYRGAGPCTRSVAVEYSQLEIDENWGMLIGHGKRRGWIR